MSTYKEKKNDRKEQGQAKILFFTLHWNRISVLSKEHLNNFLNCGCNFL